MFDGLADAIESAGDVVTVGDENVPPDAVRAACQTQRILQPRSCESEREAGFVRFVLDHPRERNRKKLRQMRYDAHRPVVRFSVAPDDARANAFDKRSEILDALIGSLFIRDQSIRRAFEHVRISALVLPVSVTSASGSAAAATGASDLTIALTGSAM